MIDNVAVGRHIFNGTRRIPADGGNKNKIPVMSIWLQGEAQWMKVTRQAVKLGKS